jgi:ABC-2 type transport system ATP-binding protein
LTKRYGSFAALDDCTLQIEAGEVFGLLGPNGAGKTTLVRLLLGFLSPTSGTAQIDGLDCFRDSVQVRQRLAYLPAEARLFRRMRARDVLSFLASVRQSNGSPTRALQMAQRLDLDVDRRVALMSTGMRQKLALAATLSQAARLLVLDEPTSSLDPNIRREVVNIVRQLRADGCTVLFSSHVLSEVEEVCDRVAILREGRLVHLQNMRELRRKHRVTGRWTGDPPVVPPQLRSRVRAERDGDRLRLEIEGDLSEVLDWISALRIREMTIEPFGVRAIYERFHQCEEPL